MIYKVVLTSEAEDEISLIYEYLLYSLKNSQAANEFQTTVFKKIRNLESMPKMYPVIKDSNYSIRKMTCLNYIILFRITESNVIVLRVFHSSKNY